MDTQRAAIKTALLVPAGPIEAWGVQQILQGNAIAGGNAVVIGIGLIAAFVALQEQDIPYEEEIVAVLSQTDPDETVDTATEAAEQAADEIEDRA